MAGLRSHHMNARPDSTRICTPRLAFSTPLQGGARGTADLVLPLRTAGSTGSDDRLAAAPDWSAGSTTMVVMMMSAFGVKGQGGE